MSQSSDLQTCNMAGMFLILAVTTVWCMTGLHCQFYQICLLRAAGDGHLAADEKRTQLTHRVPRGEVVARIIAGDQHRTFDADFAAAATNHDCRACGCIVWCDKSETSRAMCLTTC